MQIANPTSLTATALIALLLFGSACKKPEATKERHLAFATGVMQDVLPGLVKSLQEQVTSGGTAAAVPFCNEFAAQYGKAKLGVWSEKARTELGADSFLFRRISTRARNPKNTPSERQAQVLESWEKGNASPAYFDEAGKHYTMHPIKISQPLCLSCHGAADKIEKKTLASIRALYPADKATGYQLGDLRGAFVTETMYAAQ